ncbi:MAG: hypothetical protein LBH13_09535 [Cellulomonadaceae bacterium]|nr:hypothetical protein [Cellulomonadaceae bacterium]
MTTNEGQTVDETSSDTEESAVALPKGSESDSEWTIIERTREDYIRELAQMAEIAKPPEVPVIREVTPEEVPSLVDACMAEAGWPPKEPGLWVDFPKSQLPSFNLAWFTCYASYPIKVELNQHFTQTQVKFVRQWWVDTWIPCARAQGFEVEPPPSEETVLSQWHSFDGWVPSEFITGRLSWSAEQQFWKECPEFPPTTEIIQH